MFFSEYINFVIETSYCTRVNLVVVVYQQGICQWFTWKTMGALTSYKKHVTTMWQHSCYCCYCLSYRIDEIYLDLQNSLQSTALFEWQLDDDWWPLTLSTQIDFSLGATARHKMDIWCLLFIHGEAEALFAKYDTAEQGNTFYGRDELFSLTISVQW